VQKTNDSPLEASPAVSPPAEIDWKNVSFMATAHLLALSAIAWLVWVEASPWTIGLGVLWYVLCGLAITGGYHRHVAHSTYGANTAVKLFYLLFGAGAVQNSALRWSVDHRLHHTYTDQDKDPYNINRGFWWAHIGWVFFKSPPVTDLRGLRDLHEDRLLQWQDRYYTLLAILIGALLPLGLGFLWGDPIGALLVAGFLRITVQWHATGTVNSVAHWFGRRPYSTRSSARDNGFTAWISFGEGYHNFHHRFQTDYRNGVRWYQFDPTKWFVWTLSKLGFTWDLRRTSPVTIRTVRETVQAELRARRER
jgi:stearoyl-CoA desaturase (delta-9 desaturase)